MQIRYTDGTVADVDAAQARRLIREGNAQAVEPAAPVDASDSGEPAGEKPAPRKKH